MSDVKRYVPYSKGAVLEYVEGMDAGCIPMVLASDYEREVAALRALIPYAWHSGGCKYAQWDREQTPVPACTCGFNAARAAVKQPVENRND